MPTPSHTRYSISAFALVALSLAIGATSLHAQQPDPIDPNAPGRPMPPRPDRFSKLPATQPTELPPAPPAPGALPAANALPAPIVGTPNAAEQPVTRPHRAQVTFLNGQLNVRANDSSLNQILRSISRETGLKITGGVHDQRVFGDYGPASTASILATLLDGTGTNILLLEGDASTPPELILTPRGGGPTPPSPTDPGYVDNSIEDTPPQLPPQAVQVQQPQPDSGPRSIPQPLNNVNGSPLNTSPTASTFPTTNSVPTDSLPTPSTTPSTSGIVDAPNPPAPGSTTGTAPNGTATPEQIYQQLLKQQQQQQQQTNPQPPPNTPQ